MIKKPNIEHIKKHLGFEDFNAMQKDTLSAAQKSNEIVVLAPTGSGKTIAFLLPIVTRIDPNTEGVQCIIVAPSRELSLQIEQVCKSLGTGLKVNCCYGGHSVKVEKNNLSNPPHILVGTPGRLADHIDQNNFDYSYVENLVLDEFDKALEFGFHNDMSFIIEELRSIDFKILTSATKSDELPEFTKIKNPEVIDYLEGQVPKRLSLHVVKAPGKDKLYELLKLIYFLKAEPMLIFCNHREAVNRISELLKEKGVAHEAFHGGLDQEERERALVKFRNGSANVFITTDLAARGLDIPTIKHVVHYQLPPKEDAFIHRNGRTARMEKDGDAYLVLSDEDNLPEYIEDNPNELKVPSGLKEPQLPKWVTLYLSGGKKNKINKIDIVGLLMKKGKLEKDQLGLIEVKDFISFAAVDRKIASELCNKVNKERVKKIRLKVDIAR
ncbi:DEAD/DEAH box helicase [Flammeovirga agarivorans]|uniref:DEAD/DEAH box helicase n=1 Tax=Flammeovirga agarivorans TaxID=2726742 RepID=A0A7X8SQM3_9BACT|nr:DEAD/DEAH box helicase [Flammeovirga agarivorans]NLR94570.1 DEAD/DEAH box helicase [Flammeovirga agarivorans]